MNKIDLHMHTSMSNDGTYTPEVLTKMCHEAGLEIYAIADHNSTKAYQYAKPIADSLGMRLIPAVELDCHIEGTNLHILGYGIDPYNPVFNDYEEYIATQERETSKVTVRKIRELGIYLDEKALNEIAINGVTTGEMIAEVALLDPINELNKHLFPYRIGGTRSDNPYVNFYWDYCAQGKVAYSHIDFKTIDEIVKMIKDANGFAVLAHPGNNIKTNRELFNKIINKGVEGVEVYSSYHNPEVTAHYLDLAIKYDLIITIGSDFHGKTKPSIHLGKFEIPDEKIVTDRIISRLK